MNYLERKIRLAAFHHKEARQQQFRMALKRAQWRYEDKQRGYSVYRSSKPRNHYRRAPKQPSILDDVFSLIGMGLLVLVLLVAL